ncbi:MAG: methylated-DNA-[protein]-cysteine S-methyltransferase [Nocardioidaceae bacterium]|jgi:methylated-DNA-[protein]-cysteine S-methyltransferase|nr:methylated-DNA-[protein]-cysteine S-methyltransferase [Nocardioidaceae bacterium]
MTTSILVMESPVGPMRLTADDEVLLEVMFADPDTVPTDPGEPVTPLLGEARNQLQGYFSGRLRTFDLPVARRGTAFQQRVWSELEKIPYGTTSSYGEIAGRLGLPMGASRAVGTANGSNPIAIVVPCHRVIGANGKLVGYAAGLERKKYLLGLESATDGRPALFD